MGKEKKRRRAEHTSQHFSPHTSQTSRFGSLTFDNRTAGRKKKRSREEGEVKT